VALIVGIVLAVRSRSRSHAAVTAPQIVKVVIPEGSTRAQIALIAARDGLTGSYLDASRSSRLLRPSSYGAPASRTGLEGFLFPATYEVYAGDPASRLVEEQLVAFAENVGHSQDARARALGLTPYELLTVASLIEREAAVPGDRAKIAAVIYNRLRSGMPLGVDASIYYALELARGIPTVRGELTAADLGIDSPYNTRTHTGLPPTPIANPGLASIAAAAHPAHVPYMYYVLAADGCGEHVFSVSQSKFEADAAAYRAAVARNGGQPPRCRHR
jgi:uncharacterized YceG family protein